MYEKWVKVCEINKSLKNKIVELGDENEMFKGASANWRDLLKLKDEKIQELKTELENTEKFENVKFWYSKSRSNFKHGKIYE